MLNKILSELIATDFENNNDMKDRRNSSKVIDVINAWNNRKSTFMKLSKGSTRRMLFALQNNAEEMTSCETNNNQEEMNVRINKL